jgi:type 1 glutamine amidotransferase
MSGYVGFNFTNPKQAHTASSWGKWCAPVRRSAGDEQILSSAAARVLSRIDVDALHDKAPAVKTVILRLGLCLLAVCCSESPTHSKTDGAGGSSNGGATSSNGGATSSNGGQAAAFGGRASGGQTAMAAGGQVSSGGRDTSAATGGTSAVAGASAGVGGAGGSERAASLLVFSRTLGYRHDSIPTAVKALQALGRQRGWKVTASEDAALFSDAGLSEFNVLVFLSTTGDVLDEGQQAAMQRFIRAGNGFVGVHSASDTEYDWPWYGELVGAYFKGHPAIQSASVLVETASHPANTKLTSPWTRTDEWYAFQENPRGQVEVLLRLDESSYEPGEASMGSDHPIAWAHDFDGGRVFYTALGHTDASYQEAQFLQHLTGGIEWAAR